MGGPTERRGFDPREVATRRVPRQPEGRESGQGYQPPAESVKMVKRLHAMRYPEGAMDLINALVSRFMEPDLAKEYLTTRAQRTATAELLMNAGITREKGHLNFAMKYVKTCARDSVRPR